MAKLVTVATIKQRAKVRADMENSNFVGDVSGSSDLLALINASYSKFYDLLVEAQPEYFQISTTLTPDPTTGIAALPSDFYTLLGIDLILGSGPGQRVTLLPFELAERNNYVSGSVGNVSLDLLYAPCVTDLVADTDTVDGINGWDEFIVVDVARKMLGKEESDTSELVAERKELIDRVLSMAAARNRASPRRVVDVHSQSAWNMGAPTLRYNVQRNSIKFVQALDLGGGVF